MPSACRAIFAFASAASFAHAGLIITLVPEPYPPYPTVDPIRVEVFAQLDADSPTSVLVRGLQFSLSESSPELEVTTPVTHPQSLGGDDRFWDYSSSSACNQDPDICGIYYFNDGSVANDDILSTVYWSPARSNSQQFKITQSSPTRVGLLDVYLPAAAGVFELDLFNADEPDFTNYGSWFAFGFGVSETDPAVMWSAHEGSITGGHLRFVIPEPGTLTLLCVGAMLLGRKRIAACSGA
jgi:hypothetical protein